MNAADIKKARAISDHLKGIGLKPSSYKNTPKVMGYFEKATPPSTTELSAIIEPLVRHHVSQIKPPETEITPEFVKKIVQAMHSLPENDKLEVSKGIRNASSFIYGGTKYGTHEMMHGGSSGTNVSFVDNEVVSGSGTSWTLSQGPVSGSVQLYGNGQLLTPTNDYSITGNAIITVNSFSAGAIVANYRI